MTNKEFRVGDEIEIEIETPRFGFIKRRSSGGIDFISPIPSLFNYGFVPGTLAADGDPWDALLLGPRRARGQRVISRVRGRVAFIDAGDRDDKIVCKSGPLCPAERRAIAVFFAAYARFKRVLNALRHRQGATAYGGLDESGRAPNVGQELSREPT